MSLSCEEEALKAQVVACYTYYGRLREQRRISGGEEADFSCNTEEFLTYTTQAQRRARWGDSFDTIRRKSVRHCRRRLRSGISDPTGEKVCACFFAISSGQTDNAADIWGGEEACLQAVASPGDAYAPGYMTTVTYSATELYKALHQAFPKAKLSTSSPFPMSPSRPVPPPVPFCRPTWAGYRVPAVNCAWHCLYGLPISPGSCRKTVAPPSPYGAGATTSV